MSFPFLRRRETTPAAVGEVRPKEMVIRSDLSIGMSPVMTSPVMPSVSDRVIPASVKMAVDQDMAGYYASGAAQGSISEGVSFMGYPFLAELAQRPEYRRASEIVSMEMTRKWGRIVSTGSEESAGEKSRKIKKIEAEFARLQVQRVFRESVLQDGLYGRAPIFIEMEDGRTSPEELEKPLMENKAKLGDGITALRNIEPVWTYPAEYNSTDPLRPDYFRPSHWFIQGRKVHRDRLMTIVSRPVSDLLKPAYAFGGLALSQMMKPYVENWLSTRQAVADATVNFSTSVVKTNMSAILNGGAAKSLWDRLRLLGLSRSNGKVLALDKDTEDFVNVSMPLSGLHELQAQSQEHMSAVTGIPLVKFLGITPSGLNASSDGEIRSFYDWIEAQQVAALLPHVLRLLRLVQTYLFGNVDDEISFRFDPLWSLSESELAAVRQLGAQVDQTYLDAGVLSPLEVRQRLASEEDSPYASLDVDDLPEPPDQPDGEEEGESDFAADSEWDEAKHPRDDSGRFGSGEGQGSVVLSGNELGPYSDMKDLRVKALSYAESFIGTSRVNADTGNSVMITRRGVKHTIHGGQDTLVRSVPAIPALIERARKIGEERDKNGDKNILSVETYEASTSIDGKQHKVILTVKAHRDGRRYYDHGFVE